MKSEQNRKEIGHKLKSLRERMKLTQEEVCQKLSIPRSAVSLIESGDRGIDAEELKEYAKIFRTQVDSLLKKNTVMSENQTFFPALSSILEEFEHMGIPRDEIAIEGENILKAALTENNIIRANLGFRLNVTTNPELKTLMISWVDEIASTWPASKPALQLDYLSEPGNNQLSFNTIENS